MKMLPNIKNMHFFNNVHVPKILKCEFPEGGNVKKGTEKNKAKKEKRRRPNVKRSRKLFRILARPRPRFGIL